MCFRNILIDFYFKIDCTILLVLLDVTRNQMLDVSKN